MLPVGARVGISLAPGGREGGCEVSVDGVRREGLGVGGEVRVWGEEVGRVEDVGQWGKPESSDHIHEGGKQKAWVGGVPCVMRGASGEGASGDEGWVGGLNGLLKFNYPFGEEAL